MNLPHKATSKLASSQVSHGCFIIFEEHHRLSALLITFAASSVLHTHVTHSLVDSPVEERPRAIGRKATDSVILEAFQK